MLDSSQQQQQTLMRTQPHVSSKPPNFDVISRWSPEEVGGIAIACLIVPLILGGNLLVIVAVARYKRLQTPTNYFLVSLAVSDICTGLMVPFVIAIEIHRDYIVDVVLCLTEHCLTMTVCGTSILNLTAIAVDRYLAICHPFQYAHVMSGSRVLAFTLFSWVYTAIIAWSPLMGWHRPLDTTSDRCTYHLITANALILLLIALFVVPYGVIFFCYAKIIVVARRQLRAIRALELSQQQQQDQTTGAVAAATNTGGRHMSKDTKYAKTLGIVIGFFVVLWLPYQVCILVDVVTTIVIADWLRTYMALLSYCNSAINPWIYAFRNSEFKSAFKELLNKLVCCGCYCRRRRCCCRCALKLHRGSRTAPRVKPFELPINTCNTSLTRSLSAGELQSRSNSIDKENALISARSYSASEGAVYPASTRASPAQRLANSCHSKPLGTNGDIGDGSVLKPTIVLDWKP